MSVSPSEFFAFLDRMNSLVIERHEFCDPAFTEWRLAMRRIVSELRQLEDQDAGEISNRFRNLLFQCLAAPVTFDESFLQGMKAFGDPNVFASRWGVAGFSGCLKAAGRLVLENKDFPNPIRTRLLSIVRELRDGGSSFRFYCWQHVRPHFDSIFEASGDPPLENPMFIHTLADYRQADLFDVLLKVGPLRSTGITGIPESCLSAPKFGKLIQFVWSGCKDEEGMGLDPAGMDESLGSQLALSIKQAPLHVAARSGFSQGKPADNPDEFALYKEPVYSGDKCYACYIEIGDGDGRLVPPNAGVLSFDPQIQNDDAASYRDSADGLRKGMFLVVPRLGDVDFGCSKPKDDLARVWKERLRHRLDLATADLVSELQRGGIYLKTLANRVKYWSRDADPSGIHAPLEMSHFQILIKVLEKEEPLVEEPAWWQKAWREIQVSRGVAQLEGKAESQLIRGSQLKLLRSTLSEIRAKAASEDGFSIAIPGNLELKGRFVFYKIQALREGYLVPTEMLWQFVTLDDLEQWRLT